MKIDAALLCSRNRVSNTCNDAWNTAQSPANVFVWTELSQQARDILDLQMDDELDKATAEDQTLVHRAVFDAESEKLRASAALHHVACLYFSEYRS